MKKKVVATPVEQQLPQVLFKKCKLFDETWERHKGNPAVAKAMSDFIAWKSKNPLEPFGSKDRRFVAGPLTAYIHAGLTFDISLIYKISGRNPTVIYLYAIGTHDETGTAGRGGSGHRRGDQIAKRMDSQQF